MDIFLNVILPILILMGLGVLLQRVYGLHMATLSRLNIYLFVPAFLFVRIYYSRLSLADIGWMGVVVILAMLVLGVLVYGGLRVARVSGKLIGPVLLASVLYNAGNFGAPVAELLYPTGAEPLFRGMTTNAEGPQVQGILVMLSNLTLWFLGYVVLAMMHGDWRKGIWGYLKLPMLYVIIAAFVMRWVKDNLCGGTDPLPGWVRFPLQQATAGMVPVALITLGAQLGTPPKGRIRWNVIGPVVVLKLMALPLVTAALVAGSNLLPWPGLHLWPWPGAQLIIAAAGPTAVNTLLLALELDGDSELAAGCVFWTTVASAVTVTATIFIVMVLGRY